MTGFRNRLLFMFAIGLAAMLPSCNPGPGDAIDGICDCFEAFEDGQDYAGLDSAAKIELIECINDVSVVYKRERERRILEINNKYEAQKQKARYEYRDQKEKQKSELQRIEKEQKEAQEAFVKEYKEKLNEEAQNAGCRDKLKAFFQSNE